MNDSLPQTILEARQFLSLLKENNNRDWFQDHKTDYEQAVKNPGHTIGLDMSQKLRKLTGKDVTHKLFRINRDIRFSKDKTPYNTHLHISWSNGTGPGFYFGISPEYVTAGCGVMGLQKIDLDTYRALVDRSGDTLATAVKSLVETGYRIDEPELKRVPAPYDKAHSHAELLRRKSLTLWNDLDPNSTELSDVFQCFELLHPIYKFCGQIK